MNIYLFSPCDAFLRIDGDGYNLTKHNPVAIANVRKNQLITLIPKGNFEESYFLPSSENHCKNMRLIDLYDGFLLIPKLILKRNRPRKTLANRLQNYFGLAFNISVVTDGGIKLIISGENRREEVELYFEPTNLQLIPSDNASILFIILENEKKHIVSVALPDIEILFSQLCDEYKLDKNLTTTVYHEDLSHHREDNLWEIGRPFKLIGRSVKSNKKDFCADILPYAFLQEIALRGDYSQFLASELQEKALLIYDFLGSFDYIIPPIVSYKENKIALISGCNVKFVSFEVKTGKIKDITCDD